MEKDVSGIHQDLTVKILAPPSGHPWDHTSDLGINQVRNWTVFSRKKDCILDTGPNQAIWQDLYVFWLPLRSDRWSLFLNKLSVNLKSEVSVRNTNEQKQSFIAHLWE